MKNSNHVSLKHIEAVCSCTMLVSTCREAGLSSLSPVELAEGPQLPVQAAQTAPAWKLPLLLPAVYRPMSWQHPPAERGADPMTAVHAEGAVKPAGAPPTVAGQGWRLPVGALGGRWKPGGLLVWPAGGQEPVDTVSWSAGSLIRTRSDKDGYIQL